MGTKPVIDIQALVAPISDDAPVGADLGNDQVMYDLRSLADAARSAEKKWALLPFGPDGKQTVPEGSQAPPVPNWAPVLKTSLEILRDKSKDLAVTSVLLESLARIHGFAGIRDGCILVHDLAEKYWGSLFPPFDQDEFEALEQHPTIAPISGLNGASILPFAIERIPLFRSSQHGAISGIDYLDVYGEHARQVRVTREQFEAAAGAVSAEAFNTVFEDAEEALASYRKMVDLLNDKCRETHDADGPFSSSIEACLEEAVRRIRHISGRSETDSAGSELDAESQADTANGGSATVKTSGGSPSGPLHSREEAYEMLRRVADFFARTEPHSPVSTALKRIVAWRSLSFPDLMKELVSNDDALRDLFRLTGFREQENDS